MSADVFETAVLANVASSASTTPLIAAGVGVHGRIVYNDSTAVLYLANAATASVTAYTVQIPAQGTYSFPEPLYSGAVSGIWASANGNARVTTW
jgi:hypothetical protein